MTAQNAAHYHAIASRITLPGRAFIDGAFVAASDGAVMETWSLSRDKGTEAMAQYLQTQTTWITIRRPGTD